MVEKTQTYSFGEWIKQRRLALRLTQREVASAAYCSVAMIKKIEADQRQPSTQLAQSLADALKIPSEQQELFLQSARGERPLDHFTGQLPGQPSLQEAQQSLPNPGTPFLGRKRELEEIVQKMQDPACRLLTLLGPGGVGKTRLALEAARILQAYFEGGAIFVPLATVENPQDIPQAIAEAMLFPLTGTDPLPAQLARLLQKRDLLLIMDNMEQLVKGGGLFSDLLDAAPRLKLLVTSRERLNLTHEWLFTVSELDEAAALFAQTAERLRVTFDPQEESEAIQHICDLVSGHPLAVELAASWTRFMPLSQIASQIAGDIDFLSGGPRNAPQRHRSLRALFDHSWQLLTLQEQEALARLSVFRGGFAAAEAQIVAEAGWPILQGLVDKSLVDLSDGGRFDLHELTRQYAKEKLNEMGLEEETRTAHFATYRDLVALSMAKHVGREAEAVVRRLEREHDNIRAALAWGLENGNEDQLLKFLTDLFLFWLRSGYWRDGERWLKRAIEQADQQDSADLAIALNQLGVFIALQGRLPEAKPLTDKAMAMARRVEDPWALVITLQTQGQANPNHEIALAAFEEASAICREYSGQGMFDPLYASILHLHGGRLRDIGRLAEARVKLEQSLIQYRSMGDNNEIAYPLGNLGRLALQEGELQEAHELIEESVAIARRVGRVAIADWVFRLGQVQLYLGALVEAQNNLQETLDLYENIGNRFGPPAVLSNLALVALDRGDMNLAQQSIEESLRHYTRLEQAAKFVDMSATYLVFGDSIDSILHAGLVAHGQGDWPRALLYLRFAAQNRPDYQPIKPLKERVNKAVQELEARLSNDEVQAVVNEARQINLIDLLSRHSWKE